jgi:hypothetical protein
LVQDRGQCAGSCEYGNEILGSIKVGEFLDKPSEYRTMKTYWAVDIQLHAFLTSALDGGGWSASRPGRLTPKNDY